MSLPELAYFEKQPAAMLLQPQVVDDNSNDKTIVMVALGTEVHRIVLAIHLFTHGRQHHVFVRCT